MRIDHMDKEVFVLAGMISAKLWNIDPAKVKVIFTESLQPFRVQKDTDTQAEDNSETAPWPIFEEATFYDHYRKGDVDFWLAWAPITHTLAIYTRVHGGHNRLTINNY